MDIALGESESRGVLAQRQLPGGPDMEKSLADLIEALGSKDGARRQRARETLVLVGDQALAPLQGLLSSADKRLRWEAAKGLAAMIDPGSVESFVEALGDQQSDVRWLAGTGLINLGPRSVAPILRSLIEHPESLGHQQGAHRVLRALSSDNGVLAGIVGPVADALDHADAGVVAARAATALSELEQIREGR